MARCGCSCSCVVQAGSPNVLITGNGSGSSPYVVTVATEFDEIWHDHEPLDGDLSDRFYAIRDSQLVRLLASLEVAGSTDTTVTALINGVPTVDVAIPAGDNVALLDLGTAIDFAMAVDYLNLEATTVGTGASGLVTVAAFKPVVL